MLARLVRMGCQPHHRYPAVERQHRRPGRLGLSRVYVQAKRYGLDSSVGSPEIQGFVGALHGNQASQGVFITTASFSKKARDYASNVATRVVLIDGSRLAALMIRYGVDVQVRRTVIIVEIDEDFFE